MDLKAQLLKEHSKANAIYLANYIGSDATRFEALVQLVFNDAYRISQRAAWALSHCIDRHPQLLLPHVESLLLHIQSGAPEAVTRNVLRVLQFIQIPEEQQGLAADICFSILSSAKQPVAIQVFSMTVLANIVEEVPELANELKLIIEEQLPYGSAGYQSRGKKVLKRLQVILQNKEV